MKERDEDRDNKKSHIVAKYEIPHVVKALNTLLVSMGRTKANLDQHAINKQNHLEEPGEYTYRRVMMHIEAIRSIQSDFREAGLSKHHRRLDGILVNLDHIGFERMGKANMAVFERSIKIILDVMNEIRDAAGT